MLEEVVVCHGAPTLAHLKAGNLFSINCTDRAALDEELSALDKQFRPKGLSLTVLRWNSNRPLLYLYRKNELEECLSQENVQGFLRLAGYQDFSIEGALNHLRDRLSLSEDFPHEIGIFLGYPLTDVVGFILNGGKNCLCCGCWKVYSNECEAKQKFAKYNKCKEVYTRLFQAGYSLAKLTVATRTIGFQN